MVLRFATHTVISPDGKLIVIVLKSRDGETERVSEQLYSVLKKNLNSFLFPFVYFFIYLFFAAFVGFASWITQLMFNILLTN